MMLSFILIISIVTIIIYCIIKQKKRKIPNGLKELPSVPGGLPVVGHLFKLGTRPYEYLTEVVEKSGPIYTIQLGWKDILILNNYDVIKKCLKDDGVTFAGRWRNTFTDQLARYCGLTFKENEWWSEQRTFALHCLKEFGFGKSQSETAIKREMEKVVHFIGLLNEKPISSADIFSLATINVMADFILRREFLASDKAIVSLIRDIRQIVQATDINTIFVNLFPIFKKFPKIENQIYILLDSGNVVGTFERVYDIMQKFVEERRANFQPNNECQDLIDSFLLEQYKLKELGTTDTTFVDFQLVRLITELFIASYETTSTTLTWAMLILSKLPHVQRKMHVEIISIIGSDRYPTVGDKMSLNYCQAAMDEVLRYATTFPLSLPHRVQKDTSINGYFILEDTIVFPNLYACHRDPNVWEKPYDFYPEHFLNDEGKYTPRPELIPFGIGKRSCLGEVLARMEYFMFLATIIQRFQMCLDPLFEKIDNSILFSGTGGIIRGSMPHSIIFREIHGNE